MDLNLVFVGQSRFALETVDSWQANVIRLQNPHYNIDNICVHYHIWNVDKDFKLIDQETHRQQLTQAWQSHGWQCTVSFYDYHSIMTPINEQLCEFLGKNEYTLISHALNRCVPQSILKAKSMKVINADSYTLLTRTDFVMDPTPEFYQLLYRLYFKNNFTYRDYNIVDILNVDIVGTSLTPKHNDQFMIGKTKTIREIFSDTLVQDIMDFIKHDRLHNSTGRSENIPHQIYSHLIRDKNIEIWGQIPHVFANTYLKRN